VTQKFEVRPKIHLQANFHTRDSSSNNSGSQNQYSGSGIIVVIQSLSINIAMRRMVDDLRMHVFNGNGWQDPEHHMFFCEAIWIAKKIQNQDA